MPAPGTQRYLVALIPPSPILEEAQVLKEYFRDHYHSKASLNSPPHVTLHMPFEWKEAKEEKLTNALREFSTGKKPFTLSFNNFSCFAPRVIYIDVSPSDSLTALHRELRQFCKIKLNLFNALYRDLPFHPHLTLAFRDLKKNQFTLAWQEFEHKKYSGAFLIHKITLLKHDGNHWEPFHEFDF